MIRTFLTPVLVASMSSGGNAKLILDRPQMVSLYEALTTALRIDIVEARTYFFDKEGYMETDRRCLDYWIAHHD